MEPRYEIKVDPPRRYIEFKFFGFWGEETTNRLQADIPVRMDELFAAGVPRGEVLAIIDVREQKILDQATLDRFHGFTCGPGRDCRRAAFITSSALMKMQFRRIATPANFRVFTNEQFDEARDWVMNG